MNLSDAEWFKSSRSANQDACVEIAFAGERAAHVGVRDSKSPGGPELWFTGEEWDGFLASDLWKR